MDKPFAITLEIGSSLAYRTGSWRTERPLYVHRMPPCNDGCPAGENCQQWLYNPESGDYEGAWRQPMADNPLPAVMGRVCYHPCETSCHRTHLDEAVGISSVERFLFDEAVKHGWTATIDAPPSGKRVLVVGAGPSNCVGVCPDNAVVELDDPGPYRYEIDLDFCKGCGLCAEECRCGAIEMEPEAI